jgi:hypothetical protein
VGTKTLNGATPRSLFFLPNCAQRGRERISPCGAACCISHNGLCSQRKRHRFSALCFLRIRDSDTCILQRARFKKRGTSNCNSQHNSIRLGPLLLMYMLLIHNVPNHPLSCQRAKCCASVYPSPNSYAMLKQKIHEDEVARCHDLTFVPACKAA